MILGWATKWVGSSVALLAVWSALAPAVVGAQLPDRLAGEPYQILEGARARIHHVREDSLLASRVLELVEAQSPLPGLPDDVPTDVTVYLTHTRAAFDELTGGVVRGIL